MKIKMNILLVVLTLLTFNINAQKINKINKKVHPTSNNTSFEGCETVLNQKSGVISSLAQGELKTKSKSNQVTVEVKKTGGNARAIVNIYVNNDLKERIAFNKGNNTMLKKKVLNKVRNKRIRIEIVNRDIGSTFQYLAKIIGKKTSLTPNFSTIKGMIPVQSDQSVNVSSSCTGKARITIKRTSGNAPVVIKVSYKKNGKYEFQEKFFEGARKTKDFTIYSNYGSGPIEIYMKNTSNSDDFFYKIEADAIQ